VPLGLVLAFGGAGCGADDERAVDPDGSYEIAAVVDAANASFAEGDYRRTCSFYTERVRRQLVRDLGARNCVDAWRITAASLADTLTGAQRDALTSHGVDPTSVTITGATAEARFRPLPAALRDVLGEALGEISFRRIGREWRIDSLGR